MQSTGSVQKILSGTYQSRLICATLPNHTFFIRLIKSNSTVTLQYPTKLEETPEITPSPSRHSILPCRPSQTIYGVLVFLVIV